MILVCDKVCFDVYGCGLRFNTMRSVSVTWILGFGLRMRINYAVCTYLPVPSCSIYVLSCVSVYMLLSAPSVDMDGSLGDSDGIKGPGSKKRYTILFTFCFSLSKLLVIRSKKGSQY